MIYLKLFLRDAEVKSWIEAEDIKVSSILMILKRNLGYKNREEIISKTNLDEGFLRIKLCWRTDQEYSDIVCTLNGLVRYYIEAPKRERYYWGRTLLDFVEDHGSLTYIPYYKILEENGPKSLQFWTIEKTIERWIKGKF